MKTIDTLTKADLHKTLMDALGIGKKDSELLVSTFIESIVESLRKGEGVELRGFGSFRIRGRASRIAHNPRTGEKVMVPPKRIVFFTLGKELRLKLVEDINP